MANDNASKLSKNLLRMKFMQRGLDAEVKKQLEAEEKRIISDEHWYLDLPELQAKENFIIEERSFVPCEDLIYGRMSFKGFNPEVEIRIGKQTLENSFPALLKIMVISSKLMSLMNTRNEDGEEDEEDVTKMETDVTDEEMARRYESLVGSMKRKFATKRQRAQMQGDDDKRTTEAKVKKGFLKPQD